jgi:NAD(P)-dependent dehydrogenase (short-subunit alcohol dehydrogenase family)
MSGTVLISGASRGLGLEFARQYAAEGWQVHAACRHPDSATALAALGPNVTRHALQVDDKASLDRLALDLKGVPIDLLIANAGVSGPRGMEPVAVDRDSWIEVLQINAIAPLAFAGAFRANLDKGRGRKAVAITSRLGSMAENDSGGLYVYRSSKAALNAVWRSLAIDWRPAGITCLLLHPGWVRTDMGGPRGELAPDESVRSMRRVIEAAGPEASGRFFAWNGDEIPW